MLGTTPPVIPDDKQFMIDLIGIILPICKHENHARNAIQKAIDDKKIVQGDSLDKAAGIMLLRRMDSEWGLSETEAKNVLPQALGMTVKDYLSANPRDYAGIWNTLHARYQEMPD